MLKVSVEEGDGTLSLVVEGRLVGPWVDELRRVYQQRLFPAEHVELTVDLCGLTAMDSRGQALLYELLHRGATLHSSDVMNQYLVEQMAQTSERHPEACRPCRGFGPDGFFSG